jgi:hypothetical protein
MNVIVMNIIKTCSYFSPEVSPLEDEIIGGHRLEFRYDGSLTH